LGWLTADESRDKLAATGGKEVVVARVLRSFRWWAIVAVLVVALAPAYGAAMAAQSGPSQFADDAVTVEQAGDSEQPGLSKSEGEAWEEDPFHVSDESLAVSIFIPFIFFVSTVWLVWWAWNRRIDPEDREDEYRANR